MALGPILHEGHDPADAGERLPIATHGLRRIGRLHTMPIGSTRGGGQQQQVPLIAIGDCRWDGCSTCRRGGVTGRRLEWSSKDFGDKLPDTLQVLSAAVAIAIVSIRDPAHAPAPTPA